MASGEAAMQTFVLRVTIHCHGCKKKVRKVLKSIEGVQDVKVDAQLHKVMVTGTVDAETLIKRLHKSGKQALPWQHTPAKNPDPAPPTPADAPAPAEDGSKDAAVADKKPAEEPQADSSDKRPEQETASEKKKPETEKEAESEKKAGKEEEAKPRSSDEEKKDGGEGAAAEPKAEGTEPASEPAAAAKEAGDDEGEAKKKQSKPKDADRSLSPAPAPAHVPRYAHQEFNAPQPVMSYNMAQPRASVSHYAPQPERGYSQQQAGYSSYSMMQHPPAPAQQAYSQQAQPMQQWSPSYLYMPYPHASPESYYQDYYSPPGTHASPPPPPPLHDSYRLFDDENPNSCSVM
ncbi:hypothetical protein CFC21_075767 [Triticum aestivum]|uniref:HMA domain-containing protein n=2 Tax=Triticum aestivum TaxID=4565 RepID=A0A9R1HST9_WHEAT|nr:heavy metal-associated isoprenylated plant protein 35-like [Triticum aestivum]KAF7070231.1 hypothetical protein CFC21_075767 [Triticum aestivum]